MVKWPLALFGHILGFAGLELRVFGEGGFFFFFFKSDYQWHMVS